MGLGPRTKPIKLFCHHLRQKVRRQAGTLLDLTGGELGFGLLERKAVQNYTFYDL